MRLIESFEQIQRENEREREKDENKNIQRVGSKIDLNDYLPQYDLSESITSIINLSGISIKNVKEKDAKQNYLVQTLKKKKNLI